MSLSPSKSLSKVIMPKHKESENLQLQRLLIQHRYGDGSSPPSCFRDDGYGKDDDEIPSSVATEKGTLILYVENDIDFEPKSTSVLGPAKAKPSESSNEERFFHWFIFNRRREMGQQSNISRAMSCPTYAIMQLGSERRNSTRSSRFVPRWSATGARSDTFSRRVPPSRWPKFFI